jgi:hypothetical protein
VLLILLLLHFPLRWLPPPLRLLLLLAVKKVLEGELRDW